jgi:coenzyme F420-reducing hydrogenase beta subunit/polysaccharide pyruvyl transferase WcaK-like protein
MYHKLNDIGRFCTGCGACVNICPVDAIIYKELLDDDGSIVAEINEDQCIHCHKCEEVCPVYSPKENTNQKLEECYAAMAPDEIRFESSSGGAFTILADCVLEEGGYVVGVHSDQNFEAEHIIISSKDEMDALRHSKYMQSRTGHVFSEIKDLLMQGKSILYVGTPCEVAGLKGYLGQNYDNLLLVDLYCNQAPAPAVFRRYLQENYQKEDLKSITFRVKSQGWVADIQRVSYQSGKEEDRRSYNDPYQAAYHPKLMMRKTCENCYFAGNPRQGDLSIADFWEIKQFDASLDDGKGTSCICVNNEKGQKFLDKVSDKFALLKKVPFDYMRYNRQAEVQPHPARDRFYQLLHQKTFNESVDRALNGKFDVAIWGNWSEKNYGSELTYYALYQVIQQMGYDCLLFERPKDAVWGPNQGIPLFKTCPYPKEAMHPLFQNKASMYELNEKCQTFLVGSDQIWHHDLYKPFGEVCYLDFIRNDKKKIAYASSFGKETWEGSPYEEHETSMYLRKFDGVSVREKSGVTICKEKFGIDAVNVLDPVFLCDKNRYLELAANSDYHFPKHFIGCYVLDQSEKKRQLIQMVEQKLSLKANVISDAFDRFGAEKEHVTIEDWLKNILDSDFVIVDSFHGMCFSIIFEKQFIAIANEGRGMVRFTDLLSMLGLKDRLVKIEDVTEEKMDELLSHPINYDHVTDILSQKKQESIQWLMKKLAEKKEYTVTDEDIVFDRLLRSLYQYMTPELMHLPEEVRDKTGGLKYDIGVHRNEINGLRYDIGVHRSEINELRQRMYDQTQRLQNLTQELTHQILKNRPFWRKAVDHIKKLVK